LHLAPTIWTLFLTALFLTGTSYPVCIQNASAADEVSTPTWRPEHVWQYNRTIAEIPGNHTLTIYVRWSVYEEGGKQVPAYEASYITNIVENSTEYGWTYHRIVDTRTLARSNLSLMISNELSYGIYEHSGLNYTRNKVTKYDPWIDLFNFPIRVGDSWTVSSVADVTINNKTIQLKEGVDPSQIDWNNLTQEELEDLFELTELPVETYNKTISMEFKCIGTMNVTLVVADNPYYFWPDAIANWTTETYVTYLIRVQSDEEKAVGEYELWYYSDDVGNLVLIEKYSSSGDILSRTVLAATNFGGYVPPIEDPFAKKEDSLASYLLWGGFGILMIALVAGMYRIRKREVEEELTKEDIEAIESRSELARLCEEKGLSTKGSKKVLRKRLLRYVEAKEMEKAERMKEKKVSKEEKVEDEGPAEESEKLEKPKESEEIEGPDSSAEEKGRPSLFSWIFRGK